MDSRIEFKNIDNFYDEFISIQTTLLSDSIDEETGLSIEEIDKFQNDYEIELPYAYKKFLELFGGTGLKIFCGQTFGFRNILDAHDVRKTLCERDEIELPQFSFPISHWQGCNFWYFINNDDKNPQIYLFMEAGNDKSIDPATLTSYGTLTDWLLRLTEDYLKNEHATSNTDEGLLKIITLREKYIKTADNTRL